ncbi:MAG TPA: hypothetical protein DDW80_05425 [Desulfovibrio sp.]|nr:hypothetical protein [Desulfovibrio sp.]
MNQAMTRTLRLAALLTLFAVLCLAATAQAQGRFCLSDGQPVFYQDLGAGENAIVFIHGWSCDHTIWDQQTADLSRTWRTLALDMPGHGRSSAIEREYDLDMLARAVDAVVRHSGARRVVLAGHSMGLMVAYRYALAHPEKVAGLVNVDGAFIRMPEDREPVAGFLAILDDPAKTRDWRAFCAHFLQGMHAPGTPEALKERVLWMIWGTSPQVSQSALRYFLLEGELSTPLAAPSLAVIATMSEARPDTEAYLRRFFPALTYVRWDGVGHFLMLDRPGEFTRAVAGFCRSVNLSGS